LSFDVRLLGIFEAAQQKARSRRMRGSGPVWILLASLLDRRTGHSRRRAVRVEVMPMEVMQTSAHRLLR
jgi:hypothetical protein